MGERMRAWAGVLLGDRGAVSGLAAAERQATPSAVSVWVQTPETLLELEPASGTWSPRASGAARSHPLAIDGEAGVVWLWDGATLWVRDLARDEEFAATAADLECDLPRLLVTEHGELLASCSQVVGLWSARGESLWRWVPRRRCTA